MSGHPISIKYREDTHVLYVSLGPLVEPDIGFSPVRLSDDLLHQFISFEILYTNRTGTIPVEQASCPGLSVCPSIDRCISASGIFGTALAKCSTFPIQRLFRCMEEFNL